MRLAPVVAVFISAIIPAVFSTPIITREHACDGSLTKCSPDAQPKGTQREIIEGFNNLHVASRDFSSLEPINRRAINAERAERKGKKATAKAERVKKAVDKGKVGPKRPSNAKVTFGSAAKAKLDELGLHGKDRKKAKVYHKNIVKQDMKNHPGADSARIFHLAHKGGNDPKERNHITAGYYKAPSGGKPGEQIKSPWSKSFEEKNPGKPTKGLFHVYPEDQKKKTHEPSSWTHATAASAARHEAEAAKVAEKAKADAHAKATRVNEERNAGLGLSAEDKKAQREAAKAAKAAKKKKI